MGPSGPRGAAMQEPARKNQVALEGEWDLSRKAELITLLGTLTKRGPATIDLRGCTYVDSTVLSVLAALRLKFQEVPITLLGVRPQLLRVLKIALFDQLFNIVDDEQFT
jgi:anti-anti-sigma factor